jgi:hypothetical protein
MCRNITQEAPKFAYNLNNDILPSSSLKNESFAAICGKTAHLGTKYALYFV